MNVLLALLALAAPPGSPPSTGIDGEPPPAWIESATAARWLAYGSFCWRRTCADMIPPRCGDGRTPTVRVRRGDRVRFHLGFAPREVTVAPFGSAGRTRLAAARAPRWRVSHGGVTVVSVRAAAGSASYVACLKLR